MGSFYFFVMKKASSAVSDVSRYLFYNSNANIDYDTCY